MQKLTSVVAPGIADGRDTFVVVVVAQFNDVSRFSRHSPKPTYLSEIVRNRINILIVYATTRPALSSTLHGA